MPESFFDLVKSGGAILDAPGFAVEELSQLLHAAIDLLGPSDAAALSSRFEEGHDGTFADLLGESVQVAQLSVDALTFDFGAGAGTGADRPALHEHEPSPEEEPLHHDYRHDDGWSHDDLFDDGDRHDPGLHDDLLHEHVGHDHDAGQHEEHHHDGHHAADWNAD